MAALFADAIAVLGETIGGGSYIEARNRPLQSTPNKSFVEEYEYYSDSDLDESEDDDAMEDIGDDSGGNSSLNFHLIYLVMCTLHSKTDYCRGSCTNFEQSEGQGAHGSSPQWQWENHPNRERRI